MGVFTDPPDFGPTPSFFSFLALSVFYLGRSSLGAQTVKNLPAVWETWVRSLGWEDPLEEGIATHSSILAWRIPSTEEPGGLQSMGLQRVRHDWATKASTVQVSLFICSRFLPHHCPQTMSSTKAATMPPVHCQVPRAWSNIYWISPWASGRFITKYGRGLVTGFSSSWKGNVLCRMSTFWWWWWLIFTLLSGCFLCPKTLWLVLLYPFYRWWKHRLKEVT